MCLGPKSNGEPLRAPRFAIDETLVPGTTVSSMRVAELRNEGLEPLAVVVGPRDHQNGVVARERPEHGGKFRGIDSGSDTGRRTRLRFHKHEIARAHDLYDELRDHALQMQILGKHVYALGKLAQPHIGDIARDRGLRAVKTKRLQLVDEHALRANVLVANYFPDGILPAVALLRHFAALPFATFLLDMREVRIVYSITQENGDV